MFIDPYSPDWLVQLETRAAGLKEGTRLYLLLDGAFIPKFYRTVDKVLNRGESLSLLFETLPCCSNAIRAVSPFLMTYQSPSPELLLVLAQCDGWPMVSAIETTESLVALSARLSAWCIIHNDHQRFNFRFPDTRQLPSMFAALTETQRGQMVGPAASWSFMGRDGSWQSLPLPVTCQLPSDQPSLNIGQFARILDNSEADTILHSLKCRNGPPSGPHSIAHAIVSDALDIARHADLAAGMVSSWCDDCLRRGERIAKRDGGARLAAWIAAQPQDAGEVA